VLGSAVRSLNTLSFAAAIVVVIISLSLAQPSFVVDYVLRNNGKQEKEDNGDDAHAPTTPWSGQHPEPARQQSHR
jgi:hypothetical protein